MYTFWPLLIWWIAGMKYSSSGDIFAGLSMYKNFWLFLLLVVAADYFIVSANVFIYGVNDIADGDTDIHNDKKGEYENKLEDSQTWWLTRMILWLNWIEGGILLLLLLFVQKHILIHEIRYSWALALWAFWFFWYFYSAEPLRAKSKPFVDGMFNILYIIPSIIWWIVAGNSIENVAWVWFLAWVCRAMAMHAYSAIPDIEPDAEARLTTTAVLLGKNGTLFYCGVLRAISAYLAYTLLWVPMVLMGAIYLLMIAASFWTNIMSLYKRFPYINGAVGFVLFWVVVIG